MNENNSTKELDENNNCIPVKYTWLSTDSFGDRRKVTEELLKTLSDDENYLYSRILELADKTDPENRKRFSPILLDESKSFGLVEGTLTEDDRVLPVYMFNNNVDGGYSKGISFDYNNTSDSIYDDNLIDCDRTTAYINPTSTGKDGKSKGQAMLPKKQKKVIYKDTACIRRKDSNGNYKKNWNNNAYWYISYNRLRNYNIRPSWSKNPYSKDIPSVCRAQTFKVKTGGVLEGITLKLKVRSTSTTSPLIVEVRTVNTTGKNKGYPSTNVLTRQEVRFRQTGESCQMIHFTRPINVTAGTTYAVVLKSPLTPYKNAYGIGGWSRHCNEDPYVPGSAFLSEDNGYSWIKGGRDMNVSYHDGRYAPVDFLFECHIHKTYDYYITGKDYWVYMKPLYSNPVKEVSVYPSIAELTDNEELEVQVSRNGHHWITLNETNAHTTSFSKTGETTGDEYLKPYIFVRCRMRTNKSTETPRLYDLIVTAKTEPTNKAYARTMFYYPEQSGMLASHIWSEVNAPYTLENSNVQCHIDVVRNIEAEEHFKILEATLDYLADTDGSYNYLELYSEKYPNILDPDTLAKLEDKSTDLTLWIADNYINQTDNFIEFLKEYNVYLKGKFNSSEQTTLTDKFYFNSINLPSLPAYPLLSVKLTPGVLYEVITVEEACNYIEGISDEDLSSLDDTDHDTKVTYFKSGGKYYSTTQTLNNADIYIEEVNTEYNTDTTSQVNYLEDIDYQVSYLEDTPTLRLFDSTTDGSDCTVLDDLQVGELTVMYNPLWVKGLTSDDMPLKMDLWTEKFTVTDGQTTYTTAVAPRDNVREILVNPYTNDEIELIEDLDYTVDYLNNTITFAKQYTTGTIIQVKYTPNLTDLSLGLAYRLDRDDTVSQGYLKGNYWTTRT